MIAGIYGDPGKGKTAFMTAQVIDYIRRTRKAWDLYYKCCDEVEALRDRGYHFSMPDRPPVYANYTIKVFEGYDYDDNGNIIETYAEPYLINPYKIGFKRKDGSAEVQYLYPWSIVAIHEAQGPFDARMWASLPPTSSRYFEKHRHNFMTFFMDAQRLDLIDKNIREIMGVVYKMMGVEVTRDKHGRAKTVFSFYKFGSAREAERFEASGGDKKLETYVFDGCIFDYFDTYSCHDAFIPEDDDFSQDEHPDPDSDTYFDDYAEAYPQEAPEGYYAKRSSR